MRVLESIVDVDDLTAEAVKDFDYEFDGRTSFTVPDFSLPKKDFSIGLIVGPSGSGKTSILDTLGVTDEPVWDEHKSVASHFTDPQDAIDRLTGVGLNSLPSWAKPFQVLSNGEKHRAALARMVGDNARIDEFTSVVDRTVAKCVARSVSRFIRANDYSGVIFSGCHYDVIEWLEPDWVYDTLRHEFVSRGALRQRPEIKLEVIPSGVEAWSAFRDHHYLSGYINKAARCWIALWGNNPVAFMSALAMPQIKNAWREHRTVVLPDYQGAGIGVRCSDAVAAMFIADGKRYFSKTSHPRMGLYRERSSLWKPTTKNRVVRTDYLSDRDSKEKNYKHKHAHRVCFSHEYIGGES